jgi:hypothetical protein
VKNFADEVCTRAKAVDNELLGEGLQRTSSDRKYYVFLSVIFLLAFPGLTQFG